MPISDEALSRDLAKAAHAERLLSDEMLAEAFQKVRERYQADWERTQPADTAQREQLWFALRALDDVKKQLKAHLGAGILAKREIEQRLAQQK